MKKLFAIIVLLSMPVHFTYAQSSVDIKYFSNEYLTIEVPKEKAKFSKSIIQNADSSVTTDVKNIKNDEEIRKDQPPPPPNQQKPQPPPKKKPKEPKVPK